VFNQLTVEEGEIKGDAQLTPSIPLLGAPIVVRLRGGDISFGLEYGPGQIRLPIPGVTIDDATLGVFYSTQRGFGVGGQVLFSVARVGSGALTGSFTQGEGLAIAGDFTFDRRLFDQARVRIWYRQGQLGAEGELGIARPDKIRGIRSASLRVGVEGGRWRFDGNAQLTIPGIQEAGVSVRQTDDGLVIEGDVGLAPNAAIRSGSLHVSARQQAEGWKLGATGTAQPNIPGLESQLTVSYDDGAFLAEFRGAFQRGRLAGTIEAGATNRPVGPDGRPAGDPVPGAPLIIYGTGSATIQIAPWLQGTAGIRFAPNGDVTVAGEIGLPGRLEVFARKELRRPLFDMATQIPIVPGIVAEVGGNLTAIAGIGPGALEQAQIGIEYSPQHEDQTHVTGDARLVVPADAGVRLGARAGIGLGITGASATGGLELGGTLGIVGAAETSVHIDWTPAAGLAVDAEGYLHAEPRFKLDVSGYVSVRALGFSIYDHRLELAAVEVGSNLRLGVRFPIHYREGQPFDVSLDQVKFEVPEIDPASVVRDLGNRIF
jgi:hypothetical protein